MADDERRSTFGDDGEPPTPSALEAHWEAVDDDPDLSADLGYDLERLDVLVTSNSDKKVMVLPHAEERIEEDAYLVADFQLACDPLEHA